MEAQRVAWAKLHADFMAATPGSHVSLEDLTWALQCVRSRAFSGPYGGERSARCCLGVHGGRGGCRFIRIGPVLYARSGERT